VGRAPEKCFFTTEGNPPVGFRLYRWVGVFGLCVAAGVASAAWTVCDSSRRSNIFWWRCPRRADGGRCVGDCDTRETHGHQTARPQSRSGFRDARGRAHSLRTAQLRGPIMNQEERALFPEKSDVKIGRRSLLGMTAAGWPGRLLLVRQVARLQPLPRCHVRPGEIYVRNRISNMNSIGR